MVGFNEIMSYSGADGLPKASGVKPNTENKTNFLQQFKDYFQGIKNKDSKYHDISVSDVKNMEAQLHKDLIKSGATVVSYDEKTGVTKYSNGVEIHFNVNKSSADLLVELKEEGQYACANMSTDETENSDSNILQIFEDNGRAINEERGMGLVYESEAQMTDNSIEMTYSMTEKNNGFLSSKMGIHSEFKKDGN